MTASRDIDRICDEFEAAWLAGQIPGVEDFLAKIDNEHRPALLAALMPLDLTYRDKLGDTVESGDLADSPEHGSGFEVTVDSDTKGPKLSATSASGGKDRVKYFGEYELLSEIARGGMGVVYKARQVKLNRIVALKMILSGEFAGSEAVQRFHSEAEAAANLDHPGIVPIYEIGEHGGQHYFSMGFIDGPSLQDKLNAGPMPAKDAARLCRKIAEAVAYAHSKNVIHRDLKPANVLIDGNGEPKVTDFGLAKKVEGDSGLTRTGAVMGTPSYMPPEQALGQTDKIGPAADVYSLGAILYCMLTGRPPFQAANVVDTLKQVIDNEPVTPRTLDSKIPLDLETICLKCLEKNPATRYASAQEFVDELNRFEKGEPIKARRISHTARSVRWCKRNPVVAGFLALTTVLLFVLAGSLSSESKQRRQADQQAFLAEQQTNLAERAAVKALDAEAKERTARTEVESQRDRLFRAEQTAVVARDEAIKSKDLTEETLARSNYFLALARWDANRVDEALGFLERVPEKYRRFEWRLAKQQFIGGGVTCSGHTRGVRGIGISPDGLKIVSASDDNTIKIWDAISGQELSSLNGHRNHVRAVQFSPDGTRIVSASDDKTIKLWDVSSGAELLSFEGHAESVNDVSFSADGSRIASVSNDETAKIWSVAGGKELQNLTDFSGSSNAVVFSPDGSLIASTGGTAIVLWDASSGEKLKALIHDEKPTASVRGVYSVSFSLDGSKLVSASSDHTIKIWDVLSGKELRTLRGHSDSVRSVTFSPDGVSIASAGDDRTVRLWDATNGQELKLFKGHSGIVYDVIFRPDGSSLVSASNDGTVKLWTVSGNDAMSLKGASEGAAGFVKSVAFSPDGTKLASTGNDRTIELWDSTNGDKLRTLVGHTGPVNSVRFSPDGQTICSASLDSTIRFWSTTTGEELTQSQIRQDKLGRAEFSPDGKIIATGSSNGIVKLWDALGGKELRTLTLQNNVTTRSCFSPDGQTIAVVGGGQIKMWHVADGVEGKVVKGQENTFYTVQYSPDGSRIAAAGSGGAITIWEVASGEVIRSIVGHPDGYLPGVVQGLSFSADGKLIASASWDRTVKLWDVSSGEELRTLEHPDFVNDVCFSPDGLRLASACNDGTARIWHAPFYNKESKVLGRHASEVRQQPK